MEQEAEYKYRAKEQELLARIDETEAKIRQLKEEEQKSGVILTAAQQEEIENFRGEMIKLRQELRAVQRSLREDVESLSTRIKALNIWAVPILVALLAAGLAGFQRIRATRAARSAA
jgi:DNA repair exonuclease SbcCD ATPase subunit